MGGNPGTGKPGDRRDVLHFRARPSAYPKVELLFRGLTGFFRGDPITSIWEKRHSTIDPRQARTYSTETNFRLTGDGTCSICFMTVNCPVLESI